MLENTPHISERNNEVLKHNSAKRSSKLINTLRQYDDRAFNYKRAKERIVAITNDYMT